MQKQSRTRAIYAFGLVAVFALGYAASELQDNAAHATALAGEKAAYLIVSSNVIDPEPLAAYGEAAGPGRARRASRSSLRRTWAAAWRYSRARGPSRAA